MNWETVTQLGVGGTFALLVLYVVFDFLKRRSNNSSVSINKNCSGDYVTRRECTQVQKTIETRFDGLEKLNNAEFEAVKNSLEEVKTLIKNGNK